LEVAALLSSTKNGIEESKVKLAGCKDRPEAA